MAATFGLQLSCARFMRMNDPYTVRPGKGDTTPELEELIEQTAPLLRAGQALEEHAQRFVQLAPQLLKSPGARARSLAWGALIYWYVDEAKRAQTTAEETLAIVPPEAPYLRAQMLLVRSLCAQKGNDFPTALRSINEALQSTPAINIRPPQTHSKHDRDHFHSAIQRQVQRQVGFQQFEAAHRRVRNKYWDPDLNEALKYALQLSQQGSPGRTLEEGIESSRLSLFDLSHPSSPTFARGDSASVAAWVEYVPSGVTGTPVGALTYQQVLALDWQMLHAVSARSAVDNEDNAYWERLASWPVADDFSLETQPRVMARTTALNHLARQHLAAGDAPAAEALLVRSLMLSGQRPEDLRENANVEALLLLHRAAPGKNRAQIQQYIEHGLAVNQRLQSPTGASDVIHAMALLAGGKPLEEQLKPGDAAVVNAQLNQLEASPTNQYGRHTYYRNQLGFSRVLQAMGQHREATWFREQLAQSWRDAGRSMPPGLSASYLAARAEAQQAQGNSQAAAEDYLASCRALLSLTRTDLLLLEYEQGTHRPSEVFDRAISAMAEQRRFSEAFYLIEGTRALSAPGAVEDLAKPQSEQALERELSGLEQTALERTQTPLERQRLNTDIEVAKEAALKIPSGLGPWDMALARLHPLNGWIEPSQLSRTSAALEARARADRAARVAKRHQAKLNRAQAIKEQAELNAADSISAEDLQQRVNAQRDVAILEAASRGHMLLDVQHLANAEQLQAAIPANSQLLSYWVGETSAYAFVLGPDGSQVVPLGKLNRGRIVALVKRLPRGSTTDVQELYQLLVAPVRPYLRGEHTWYLPHDVIHLVPLHALHDGDHYLFEVMGLSRLNKASDLFLEKAPSLPVSTVTALAQPSPSSGVSLPSSVAEIQDVSQQLPISTILEPDATERHLRDALKQTNVLHVAAHTELNSAWPLLSRFHMKPDGDNDGSLEVRELLDLRAPRLELAVLSACDTGAVPVSLRQRRGAGSELGSLASSLIAAGARSVVASLWPVNDESTAAFFHHFYAALTRGETRERAMNTARSALAHSEEFSDPRYWAPFVLYGDHRALSFAPRLDAGN